MRYFLFVWLMAIISLSLNPDSLQAQIKPATTLDHESRVVLLQQIVSLLKEVERLQALLESRSLSTKRQPHQAVLFDVPLKAHYYVDNLVLIPVTPGLSVRPIDQKLYTELLTVLGKDTVTKHIKEWRIFANEESGVGGFVETINDQGEWIMGVNELAFLETKDTLDKEALHNLYLHEYAHIILLNRPELEREFERRFWTSADKRRASQLQSSLTTQSWGEIDAGRFETERFVSHYSQLSVAEDMAETFVAFVRQNDFSGQATVSQKKLFLFSDADLQAARLRLRANLGL